MTGFSARPIWVALIGLILSLAGILPAGAHATLVTAEPRDGAMLASAPPGLILVFNEPVAPLVFRLIGPDGGVLPAKVDAADRTVRIHPDNSLPDGTSILSWRVISADGHPVAGALAFSVRVRTANNSTVQSAQELPLRIAIWLARLLLYCGTLLGVGGAFFLAWATPKTRPHVYRSCVIALLVGAAAIPISLVLLGLDALGLPLNEIVNAEPWRAGASTSFAITAGLVLAALLFAFLALKVGSVQRVSSAIALLALAVAFACSGHAAVAAPQILTRPAVFIHVATVALWAGSLVPLLAAVRRGTHAKTALLRFSIYAPAVILALAGSGIALAVIQVATPSALWETGYGLVLLGKLALLVVIGLLAACNRLILTPRVLRGDGNARRQLARMIAAEIVLVIVVFGIVALWRFTPPPRALTAAPPVFTHLHSGELMANVTFSPQANELSLDLLRPDFSPLQAKEVMVRLANRSAGIEPITRAAKQDALGKWVVGNVALPRTGSWAVEIDALVSDFDKLSIGGPLSASAASDPPEDTAFVHLHGKQAMADVTITPGRAGIVRIELRLMRDDFAPLPGARPNLSIAHPALAEPLTLPLRPAGPGEWKAGPTTLALSGIWTVRIGVALPAGAQEVLDGPIVLEPGADKKGDSAKRTD